MKMPLLEMVQMILSDMDSDEVNSIQDTTEAIQVASIIKEAFYELIYRKEWPHLRKIMPMESVSDTSRPTWLRIPSRVFRMDEFYYNKKEAATERDLSRELRYLFPDEFIQHCNGRDSTADNVYEATSDDGVPLLLLNDTPPTYYTSFDDRHLVMDSWVSTWTSTAIGPESSALVYRSPAWSTADTFIPDLPAEAFPALLAEAKSMAFLDLGQMANEKAEQHAKRQYRMITQRGWITNGDVRYPNYGRRGGKHRHYRGRHFPRHYG